MGLAGLVDVHSGVLAWVPHVSGPGAELQAVLAEDLGVSVVIDNDANMAAVAEFRRGAGQGYRSGVLLTFGTGIGAGFIVDDEVYRGRGYAGEVGHMRIEIGGLECPCGGSGCWETRASGTALARLAGAEVERDPGGFIAGLANGDSPRGEHVIAAALDGDAAACELIEEVGRWAGVGVANLVAAFDPSVIVVGGGLGASGGPFLNTLTSSLAQNLYAGSHRPVPIVVPSAFGADAGILGSAMMAAGTQRS